MNNTLNNYILNEVSNITYDFVQRLVSQVKKHDICSFICHFLCDHVLTNNIWTLKTVKDYLEKIETCKSNEKEKLTKLLYSLLHLLGNSDKGIYTFYYPNEKGDMFADDIKNIRYYSNVNDNEDLSPIQSIVTEEVYTLLNILYDCFLYSVESKESLQKCFIIIRYLLTLTPKHYIQGNTKKITTDVIDFIFILCVWYSNNNQCPKDISLYVNHIKDIFYYRLKKKDKLLRINILFYLIHVLINKKVIYQEIDYEGINNDESIEIQECTDTEDLKKQKTHTVSKTKDGRDAQVDDKCQYLFIYTDYDQHKLYEMQHERDRYRMLSKLMRTNTKEVEIDSMLMRDPNVSITKLSC
jgi:hypothetical protein